MSTLVIKARVTKPDGSLYYRDEHEWPNLSGQLLQDVIEELKETQGKAREHAKHKDDAANLTVTLSASVDGQSVPDEIISGMSKGALRRFEKDMLRSLEKLIDKAAK